MSTLKSVHSEIQERKAYAEQLQSRAASLNANTTARSFELGGILGEIQDQELYRELEFDSFQAFCKSRGFAKTTVYRDILVARRFSLEEHGYLGATRLRLLVNRPDALDLIANGIPGQDGRREPLKDVKSRNLQSRLQNLPVVKSPELQHAVAVAIGQRQADTQGPSTDDVGQAKPVAAADSAQEPQSCIASVPPFDPNDPIWSKVRKD